MRDKDVIQHIQDLCKERSWTYYRLAKEADIPYSTLNNMVNRTNIPTIPTLQKLCDAFGIISITDKESSVFCFSKTEAELFFCR